MSIFLKIDSSSAPASRSDDFTVYYGNGIRLDGDWEIALISGYLWYSYYNISSDFGNNIIRYRIGAVVQTDIILPNGVYSITDINDYMQTVMQSRAHYNAPSDLYYINIVPNYQTLRVDVTVSNTFALDLTAGTLYALLGQTSQLVSVNTVGSTNADITNFLFLDWR